MKTTSRQFLFAHFALISVLIMPAIAMADDDAPALQEVVVTTTRTPRRIADEPARLEVIDREELDEKLSMSPGDISMLLNETSGLHVQTTSPGLGASNVRIQGLRGRYSQILADGLPLYGGQTGGIGLLQVPPLDLGQVEVLKGVASALYGASALGGVINLVSRRPDGSHDLLLNQTSRGGTDAALWWAGDQNKEGWSYSVLAGADRQPYQDVDGDGWADIPRFQRTTVRPRLYWTDEADRELHLTAGAMLEDRSGGTVKEGRVPVDDPVGTSFIEALKTQRYDFGLNARWPISPDRIVTLRASAMQRDERQTFGDDLETSDAQTQFAEAALSGTDGKHDWVLGLAAQHDHYHNDTFPNFDFNYSVPGLFAQDEYRANEALTLSASARVDHHNVYGTYVSPRIAMLWRPGGADSPWRSRISIGTGFFAPTPVTEETEATGLSRITPLGNVQAETARGGSADLDRIWKLEEGSLEGNITIFGSEVEHALGLEQVGPTTFAFVNASGPTRTMGTELLLRWHAGPIVASLGHAYVDSTELASGTSTRRNVPLNPRHSLTFTGVWEDEKIGRIGLEGFYTGKQSLVDNPYLNESPAVVILGFLVERRIGDVKVFLNAENITDRRLTRFQLLVLPAQAPDGRWTTDAWTSLEGRVINLGLRWQFAGDERD